MAQIMKSFSLDTKNDIRSIVAITINNFQYV